MFVGTARRTNICCNFCIKRSVLFCMFFLTHIFSTQTSLKYVWVLIFIMDTENVFKDLCFECCFQTKHNHIWFVVNLFHLFLIYCFSCCLIHWQRFAEIIAEIKSFQYYNALAITVLWTHRYIPCVLTTLAKLDDHDMFLFLLIYLKQIQNVTFHYPSSKMSTIKKLWKNQMN